MEGKKIKSGIGLCGEFYVPGILDRLTVQGNLGHSIQGHLHLFPVEDPGVCWLFPSLLPLTIIPFEVRLPLEAKPNFPHGIPVCGRHYR
ncbi:hypothetical protein PoB_005158800 [Plakobranchus ocellatus]|uniref:Uncharacterized protein n=1 Tax=Plakobranchus ocellatus TaxID=259542 RepID=A0AAV4C0Z0_9GAST|nr:hypothetical protein PoB_005158800 [Plakobranchus ocellatus]